jgi:ppGpp synthetase/RelA/SpoT-type nucleotidyltranferase
MHDPNDPKYYLDAISRYRKVRPDYELLTEHLKKMLHDITGDLGIYPIIMGRAKSLESFAEKIQRPGRISHGDPLAEMTDLSGVRVITHTLDEVTALTKIVSRKFLLDLHNSEDKREKLAYKEFGYLSTHFIIQLKEVPQIQGYPAAKLERLPTLKAELQLRTLAQHLWADIYHELGYKNEFQLPARWEREFARLAALLEYCDQGFEEIKNAMRTYESSYGHYMSKEQLESLAGRLEILLQVDGDNVKALHRLIKTYLALGHNDQIRMILERNEALLHSYPPALRDIGVAYCQAHKPRSKGFTLGKALLRQATETEKKDIDALCSLGGAYRKEGSLGKSLACYREAHELDPSDPYSLGNYIALELLLGGNIQTVPYFHALIRQAALRCRKQVEVKVNLPWALFDLGLFHLYLGDPNAALSFYAKGIEVSSHGWMIRSANKTIDEFIRKPVRLEGLPMLDKLLRLGWWIRASSEERKKAPWRPSRGKVPLRYPVLILAGGCGGLESQYQDQLDALREALKGFRGIIVSGGTKSGVAGIAGDIQAECDSAGLQTVGYLPRVIPDGTEVDGRYSRLRRTRWRDFSALEPLAFWEDFLAAGGDPAEVKLIGFNGGKIAACEFRMALAFGARVGIIQNSGRAADELLWDSLWKNHQTDKPVSLFALTLAHGDVEAFLASPDTA